MYKRFFILKFDAKKKNYLIEPIKVGSGLDTTKMSVGEVNKIASETWTCTNKQALIDEVENIKKDKIESYKKRIKSIQDRKLVING